MKPDKDKYYDPDLLKSKLELCRYMQEHDFTLKLEKSRKQEFFIPFEPPRVTAQQKGINFRTRTVYEKPKVKAAREEITWQMKKHAPEQPFAGAVQVSMQWYYSTKDKKKDKTLKTTRPDLDNMTKLVLDAMTDLGFWQDDAQVTTLKLRKYWGVEPGLLVTIAEDYQQ